MFRDRATLGFKVWVRGLGFRALHLGFVLMWWSRSLSLFLALSNFERERESEAIIPPSHFFRFRSLARSLAFSLPPPLSSSGGRELVRFFFGWGLSLARSFARSLSLSPSFSGGRERGGKGAGRPAQETPGRF